MLYPLSYRNIKLDSPATEDGARTGSRIRTHIDGVGSRSPAIGLFPHKYLRVPYGIRTRPTPGSQPGPSATWVKVPWTHKDSNPEPTGCRPAALPLSYASVDQRGFEPRLACLQNRCITIVLSARNTVPIISYAPWELCARCGDGIRTRDSRLMRPMRYRFSTPHLNITIFPCACAISCPATSAGVPVNYTVSGHTTAGGPWTHCLQGIR